MPRRAIVIALGLAVVVVLAAIAGFAVLLVIGSSEDNTRQAFVSPTGERNLYLIETCRADACTHQAVLEMPGPAEGNVEIRCGLDIAGGQPVFESVEIDWLPDETAVLIRYAQPDAVDQTHMIDFARDCNA